MSGREIARDWLPYLFGPWTIDISIDSYMQSMGDHHALELTRPICIAAILFNKQKSQKNTR